MSDSVFKQRKGVLGCSGRTVRKWLCSTSLFVLAGMMASAAYAQDWTGAVSNDWGVAANWNSGVVPTAGSAVTINAGSPRISSGNWTSGTVVIGNAAGGGVLEIFSGSTLAGTSAEIGLDYSGAVTVGGVGAAWNLSGNLNVGHRDAGTLTIGNGVVRSADSVLGVDETGSGFVNVVQGGSLIGSGALVIGQRGSGVLSLSGNGKASAQSATLGAFAGSSGIANLESGARLDLSGLLYVGAEGNGALSITGTGLVSSGSGYVGHAAGSTGLVNVSGSSASWISSSAFLIGVQGDGRLNVLNGGLAYGVNLFIGDEPGGTGTVKVDGTNSRLEIQTATYIGNGGTATLDITNGGRVTVAGTSSVNAIAASASSNGVVRVNGTNSMLDVANTLAVGAYGAGTLEVAASGVATIGADLLVGRLAGGYGSLAVTGAGSTVTVGDELAIGLLGQASLSLTNGAAISSLQAVIAGGAGSVGTAVVSGTNSSWTNAATLLVGDAGDATLSILAQGKVQSHTTALGGKPDGRGVVKVDGTGSILATGALTIGSSGSGSLDIANGGLVKTSQGPAFTSVAQLVGSQGALKVEGVGSKLDSAGPLAIGLRGTGTAIASAGGTISSAEYISIGLDASSVGSLAVTGPGSAVEAASYLGVGLLGQGDMTVSGGGNVTSTIGYVGRRAGSTGTATISGPGSNWTNSGALYVGDEGSGSVTVGNGGLLRSLGGYIGQMAGSSGTVLVDGASSAWDSGGATVFVGLAGPGSLTVANGGTVTGPVRVLGQGSLGGHGSVGAVVVAGGSLRGVQGQTLTMNSLLLNSTAKIDVSLGAPGNGVGLFKVNGNLALDGTLHVTNAGGFGQGVYRIIDYTGSLTDNGLAVGTMPSGTNGIVQTAVANQVNLLVSGTGNDTQFWNGTTTTADGTIHGGNGSWVMGPTNWTDANGTAASAWGSQFAVFQNNPGIVTVDNQAGVVTTSGLQFIGNGWRIGGQALTLDGSGAAGTSSIRVGDGTAAGVNWTATIDAEMTGSSMLVKNDLGTLILTGSNSYTGGTTIAAGTLQIGDGGTTGSISGLVDNAGTLAFNRSNSYAFGGQIVGTGAIRQIGNGTTTLAGNSSAFTGSTTVVNGTLAVNGQLGGSISIQSGATLAGSGTVGFVSVAAGGTISGAQGQTLTSGTMTLASGSTVNVTLGVAGGAGLFQINGDLTLDGTLNVTDAGGFGMGVYRIFNYTGALTDNGLDIGTTPTLPAGTTTTVQTSMANQVNLVVDNGGPIPAVLFWNGTTTTADGTIHGGNGTWTAGPATNWTNASGSTSAAWGSQFAVFQNNPGNVTVDDAAGAVSASGLQFIGNGWNVAGDAITLNGAGGNTTVRVGDGTASGAGWSATIASELAGTSRLVKDDLGTLILAGASSYTGGTTVAAGTLQIGNGGTSGSISGDVLNNGVLAFNRSDATTFGGLISGLGGVRLMNGDLTLTADNSYTGGTGIAAGSTLRLGNGGMTGSVVGNIANNGALVFNRSNDLTFAGILSGNGAVRQIGSGKTELTGNSNAFNGTTTVESGILAVNGQLGGSLDVWTGGRLQGTGTVGNTVVSGVIAPGNSMGTINVGKIIFNAGSIYEVEVNGAGQSDKIVASGTATINGGSVQVLAGAGNYAPATTYTILTATGGRTGTFTGGVTSNLAFLDPSLSYDANNVYLTMTRNDILFQNVGITPNQIATGGGGESLGLGNPVYDAVLNLSAPQAQHAFDQLSGELHASAKTTMLEDSRFIRSTVNDRIRAAFDGVGASNGNVVTYDNGKPQAVAATTDGGAIWGHAFGAWGHWDGDGNAARLDRSIGGFFVGADAPAFDTWRFGAVAGYSRTSFDVKDRHSSGTSDNYHVGLYGGTAWGDLAFRTGAAYTWHDISTNRSVIFPGFGNSLTGDYGASTAQVFGELGYKMQAGNVAFEPFANLAYVNLHTEGFTEKGGAAALISGSSSTNATFTTLGLRAASSFTLGETVVTAKGMVGWRHAFGDVTPDSVMRFAGGGNAFTIGGVPIARNAAVVEAGLDFALSPTATLGVSYGRQFGSGVVDQSVRANFNVKF